jgi:hypothetical protein
VTGLDCPGITSGNFILFGDFGMVKNLPKSRIYLDFELPPKTIKVYACVT